jgi:hypothetical protein
VVYWTNFVSSTGSFELKKTYYNQTTVQLKEYGGSIAAIRLAQGERYLYVLSPTNAELDIIDKESEEVVETYNIRAATNAVGAAEGNFFFHFLQDASWGRKNSFAHTFQPLQMWHPPSLHQICYSANFLQI